MGPTIGRLTVAHKGLPINVSVLQNYWIRSQRPYCASSDIYRATRVLKSALLLLNDILFLMPASTALLGNKPHQPQLLHQLIQFAMLITN